MPCQVCQSLSFFLKVLQVWSLPIHSHLTSAKTTSRRGALDVWLWKVSTSSAALKSEVNFKKQRLKWSELQCTATLCLYFSFLVSDLMWFLSKNYLHFRNFKVWNCFMLANFEGRKLQNEEDKVRGDEGVRWQGLEALAKKPLVLILSQRPWPIFERISTLICNFLLNPATLVGCRALFLSEMKCSVMNFVFAFPQVVRKCWRHRESSLNCLLRFRSGLVIWHKVILAKIFNVNVHLRFARKCHVVVAKFRQGVFFSCQKLVDFTSFE